MSESKWFVNGLAVLAILVGIVGCDEAIAPDSPGAVVDAGVAAQPMEAVECDTFTTLESCSQAPGCFLVTGIDVTVEMVGGGACYLDEGAAPSLRRGLRFVDCVPAGTAGRIETGLFIDPADGHCLHFSFLTDGTQAWESCEAMMTACPADMPMTME